MKNCKKHGLQKAVGDNRCQICAIESVDKNRKRKKALLVAEHGGCCKLCGYNRSIRALQFHHLDPAMKEFSLSDQARSYSLDRQRSEAEKCILVCANCHMEIEDGMIEV